MSDQYIAPSVKKDKLDEMMGRNILMDGEEIEAAIWGSIESSRVPLGGSRGQHQEIDLLTKGMGLDKRSGLICLTNQRVIFYMPKMLNRYETETYPINQINSIQFTKGMRKGKIDITIVNDNRVIKGIDNDEGRTMVDRVQMAVQKANQNNNSPTVVSAEPDPIKALKMKFVNGEITKEEYEEKKKILED